jgi:hypothetical protein
MAVSYSVTNGGFLQAAAGSTKYIFELSGELDIPSGFVLPYQYAKSAITLSSATAVFTTAGTATYTLLVTSTDNAGANPVTHINNITLTPSSGAKLTATIASASVSADRIFRVTLTKNSGTPSSDFTLTLE